MGSDGLTLLFTGRAPSCLRVRKELTVFFARDRPPEWALGDKFHCLSWIALCRMKFWWQNLGLYLLGEIDRKFCHQRIHHIDHPEKLQISSPWTSGTAFAQSFRNHCLPNSKITHTPLIRGRQFTHLISGGGAQKALWNKGLQTTHPL